MSSFLLSCICYYFFEYSYCHLRLTTETHESSWAYCLNAEEKKPQQIVQYE